MVGSTNFTTSLFCGVISFYESLIHTNPELLNLRTLKVGMEMRITTALLRANVTLADGCKLKSKIHAHTLELLEQVTNVPVAIAQSSHVGGEAVIVLDVGPAAGQAEASDDFRVAKLGRQVDGELTLAIANVDGATKGAERLGQGQHALTTGKMEGGFLTLERNPKIDDSHCEWISLLSRSSPHHSDDT